MNEVERAYYSARIEEHRKSAEAASDPSVRAIHKVIVERYQELLHTAPETVPLAAVKE